jgi:hypothetical protein
MEINKNDIPLSVAIYAHSGTSWTPEKRGEQIQDEYLHTMTAFYTGLMTHVKTEAEREYLETAADRYRHGYIQHYTAYLHSKSRIVSSAIAGPSNFPGRMMEKRDATPTTEKAFEGGIVRDNAEADRIQIIYKERPGPELYGKLKARGFRWSPTAGAWQRYRTQDTRYAVEAITGIKI